MADTEHRAVSIFQRLYDADPTITASAPGRINLVGGHTDYNDGMVLPMGIDRRTAVAARPRPDDRLRLHSETVDQTVTVIGENPRNDWTDYVAGVRWALREAGHAVGGADLAVVSDVPVGAGLSSSAALSVATCHVLDTLADIGLNGETAARLCTRAENDFAGVPCGLLDGYASACAPAAGALELDCRTLTAAPTPLGDCGVVVLDTGVSHDLTDSAYADRVSTCERAVRILDNLLDHDVNALRDVSPAAFDRVDSVLPETLRARCRHVITENERVRTAADALRDDDPARAGDLMDDSHRSLRDDYEVSCAELDAATAAGRATSGVLGSRMTGAGFGGCTVQLVKGELGEIASSLADEYRARVDQDPTVYSCMPGRGAYASRVSST